MTITLCYKLRQFFVLVNSRTYLRIPAQTMSSGVDLPFVDGNTNVVGSTLWSSLLPEILVKIFGYLNAKDKMRAALVCWDWRAAVNVRGGWKKTVVKVQTWRLTEMMISTLVDHGVRCVKIQSSGENGDRADIANRIGQLVAAMTNIEHLDVFRCRSLTGDLLAEAIQPTRLVALKRLNLGRLESLTGEWLTVLIAKD